MLPKRLTCLCLSMRAQHKPPEVSVLVPRILEDNGAPNRVPGSIQSHKSKERSLE